MKYTAEERLDIGRRIYNDEISRYEAAVQYGISDQTARNYMRMYRDANQLPPKGGKRAIKAPSFQTAPAGMEEFESMTKEIDEYITFFNEARPAYSLNYLTPKQYRESHLVLTTV